jgi:hypothetical protein
MLLDFNETLFNPYQFIKHWFWYPFTDLYGNPTVDTPECRRLNANFDGFDCLLRERNPAWLPDQHQNNA